MKARAVRELDPAGTLVRNAERIIRTRCDELAELASKAAADESRITKLHDARIAAKRLRYVLDVFSTLFERERVALHDDARRLQETLGEVHDCDVLIERVQGRGLSSVESKLRARRAQAFSRFVNQWGPVESRIARVGRR